MSTSRFSTSYNFILSELAGLGLYYISLVSSLDMDDSYLWIRWIFFSGLYGLNITMWIFLIPMGGESSTYPILPIPGWMPPVLIQCNSLYLVFTVGGLVGTNTCDSLHLVPFIGVHYS